MKITVPLIVTALLPVAVSVLLHLIFKHAEIKSMSERTRQIIIGVIFGIVAICGTEFGIPITGATINARDAAPLCAGLIFGPLAGIIAGLIGGIERWIAVAWGAGYYTRLACSVSTVLTGLIAGLLKKYVFDQRRPNCIQAFGIGVVVEVIHMLMIFITNMSEVKRAFEYVSACTVPMVSLNAIALALAVFVIDCIDKKKLFGKNDDVPTISGQFQKHLLITLTAAFAATMFFNNLLQKQIAQENTKVLLRLSLEDAVRDVQDQCDETLLHVNRLVASYIINNPDCDLKALKQQYNVCEIDVINTDAIITASSEDDNVGFDMLRGGDQSAEFMRLLYDFGPDEIVQAYMPTAKDETVYRKYSGVKISDGFVQVAYNGEQMNKEISSLLYNVVSNRHIGESGSLMVLNNGREVVSSTSGTGTVYSGKASEFELDPKTVRPYTVYEAEIYGKDYFYMYTTAENYSIVGILPKSEAFYSSTISIYLSVFTMMIIFGVLFLLIYLIIKNQIVGNINKVNDSLKLITDGNLDTVVDVTSNKEFTSLSYGINTTVDALKKYIAEANARIDSELQYAREIQLSALPSHFPAFPERTEFDIYALMQPAREVGGDFYDFYFVGRNKLVILVADVSGKGIPASLFMMRAKTTLKTYAESRIAVADILTNANYTLCEGNDAGIFVTCWMGFLNLETGELKYANAGHNKPMLRRKDGRYDFLDGKAGFVLGGLEGVVYKEQSILLEPGDEIFLYTDGVTEAMNAKRELFGEQRLMVSINNHLGQDARSICTGVRYDVEQFYKGSKQFDDITELCVQFKKYGTRTK